MTGSGIRPDGVRPEIARLIPMQALVLIIRIICAFAVLSIVPHSCAQSQSELKVKAAFVFNLTKYVEWPTPKDRLVIGIVGTGPMVDSLRGLAGMVSDSRPIAVLVSPADAELRRCDLVYVASSSGKKIELVLDRAAGLNILTVGDAASFTKQGGMVALVTVGDHVEIQVNLESSQKARLKISSRLLNLARVTRSGTAGGN